MAPLPPLTPTPPESTGARVPARTRSEVSDETIRQSDASLIFVKLRKMIASDTQRTDTILGTIAVAAQALTGATGAAVAMPRDGAVVCVGRSGETAPELGDRLNVDSGISGECLRTGVIMRCDDASRDYHVDPEVCRQLGLQSIAVVPLRGQHGRVGVLEAFSTQSYAFDEDKMDLLGRLAGLAEAAWARGAVTESPIVEPIPLPDEIAAAVEAPAEQFHAASPAIPLAHVREVFAALPLELPKEVPQEAAGLMTRWRPAMIVAGTVLALVLLSVYGWRAWYSAIVTSRTTQSAVSSQKAPEAANAVGSGFSSQPDVVRPAVRRPLPAAHAAKPDVEIPDQVIRRQRQSAHPVEADGANPGTAPDAKPNAQEAPILAASNADASDLGKVLATPPALPRLDIPISQGTAGGVLLHRVQPVYPPEARRMHLQGSVVLDAIVTVQGEVNDLKLVSGDRVLAQAATEAVRRWRYSPYSLNGKPIPKPIRITVSFIAPQ